MEHPSQYKSSCDLDSNHTQSLPMENDSTSKKKWGFRGNPELSTASEITVRGVLTMLMTNLDQSDPRPVIPLGHGDPSAFSCFRTTEIAEDAIADAVRCAKFNGYSHNIGILPARRAVADYLSQDLPNKLSPDDVFLTVGCGQAIQTIITVLANSKANILLPRPGFPHYESIAQSCHLEVRHFDLLPDKDWEVDLDAVEALADENTAAIVIINPGNPCGNVFTHQHLQKIAETAKKLGILVIADEVYDHIAFGKNPFVPMGVFGSITPVVTLGSISKRWIVPGWRLGWLVINDPNGILKEHGILECISGFLGISCDPPTFIQGALPDILGKTKDDFFVKIISIIKETAETCYERVKDIPGIICPSKPQGSMFVMVKLDLSVFEDIKDDLDFCGKLVKEESVLILPGVSVGLKNWLRITFAIEPSYLEDGLKRLKAFCREMEMNGSAMKKKWAFRGNPELNTASEITIRGVLAMLKTYLDQSDSRPVIPLGQGDPSAFSCFRTSHIAEDAIADALHSAKFTGYSPSVGILPARRAVAEYLSQDLPNKISPDDVFLTVGCTQAIQSIITVLADSKANILLPKPGYPYYEAFAQSCHLEVRHFDLLPEKDWEVDLDAVEALADENTAAIIIINPEILVGMFSHTNIYKRWSHMFIILLFVIRLVAETARKLGILVLADEVYGHIAFGKNPFVPMGVFGSITPVITLGSISKRWIVPGWRLGWLVINDPNGILKKHGIIECITQYLNISSHPPTFIQGAVPDILGKTKDDFFVKIINTIKEGANSCYERIKDIPGVICPSEPEGSMFVMVKLDLSILEDIKDDLDFCVKLAKEESVIILPGISVGLKNWLRLTFAIEPSSLKEGIKRLEAFCKRHSKKT
ncbi:hypothetical protein OSB04_014380 [Centaurea solstitialis]|uniref:Aminotransferase class I/classII large domain-containing protein n=1 Tax=Centaurea solstitialis TaxID=347529 RepID=A0AA38SWZ5_9ASTR|nr:hypothetical protein OSB04_014380 [Centaurea solstitialis]